MKSYAKQPIPTSVGLPGVPYIVAVASGKGGVGKSTLAANLAVALQQQGLQVGLADMDIYGPSQAALFGLKAAHAIQDGKLVPALAQNIKIATLAAVTGDQPLVWRGPLVMSAVRQLLFDVAWAPLDVLLADLPPGTGDAPLTFFQSVSCAGAVVVCTPHDLALMDARRALHMLERLQVPIIGLVENMSHFTCDHCGALLHPFGQGMVEAEAAARGYPFLGAVPLHLSLRQAADEGVPLAARTPQSPIAAVYAQMALQVIQQLIRAR